jgi:hypothetical protein
MKYHYAEYKFKKMKQAEVTPFLLPFLIGIAVFASQQDFKLIPVISFTAIMGILLGAIIFIRLRRTRKLIASMRNNEFWLTPKSLFASGDMGSSEMPLSSIKTINQKRFQGVPSIIFELTNGERMVLGGLENQDRLISQLREHIPEKFPENRFKP